jgi:sulfur carrier protein ThiS
MINMTLSSSLVDLLPPGERPRSRPQAVPLSAGSWPEAVHEIRHRFPHLADRLLGDANAVQPGFVLVVNGEVVPRRQQVALSSGDDIYVLAQIAGG